MRLVKSNFQFALGQKKAENRIARLQFSARKNEIGDGNGYTDGTGSGRGVGEGSGHREECGTREGCGNGGGAGRGDGRENGNGHGHGRSLMFYGALLGGQHETA